MRFVPEWNPTTDAVDPERLRNTLESYPLQIAVLFGSQATETVDKWSDLDLAVAFQPAVPSARRRRLLDEITVDATETTGFEAVDLVDLDSVGPHFGYEICTDGVLLLGDESVATERERRFLVKKLDFEPVRGEWREAMAARLDSDEFGRG